MGIRNRCIAGLLVAGVLSVPALAAPVATTYSGIVGTEFADARIPGIIEGEAYAVTLVMDNGGAGTSMQTWDGSQLSCVIFRFNNEQDVVFAQRLAADGDFFADGTATTDAAGSLTGFFSEVRDTQSTSWANAYRSVGFPDLTANVAWFLNGENDVFFDQSGDRGAGDAAGGIPMVPASWSDPQPFTGTCTAGPTGVPALPGYSMLALLASLGLAAFRGLVRAGARARP